MPAAGEPLFDALQIALAQAATIHGRKYRYGALLLAGDDLIPMKSGSNRKVFLRDNIHAEMSVLKGCDRPRGKDMLIARLAPAKRARSRADVEDDDDSEDEGNDLDEWEEEHFRDICLCEPRPYSTAECQCGCLVYYTRREWTQHKKKHGLAPPGGWGAWK